MNLRPILPPLLGLAVLTAARAAHADAIPPDEAACTNKTAGDACMNMGSTASGTCSASKCTKLDYSRWDGGGAPPSVEYDCLKCLPASGDGGSANDGGTADAGDGKSGGGGCSASGTRLAGAWGLALVPMAIASLLRRRRRAG